MTSSAARTSVRRTLLRNLDADVDDPVESWPVEAMQTVLERGTLRDWRRIAAAVRAQPWGPVARTVEHVLGYDRPYGVAELMERSIARARERAEADEKQVVAARLSDALAESGLTRADFAARLGTSTSRLSTYLAGKVTPAATVLVRAERIAASERSSTPQRPERTGTRS